MPVMRLTREVLPARPAPPTMEQLRTRLGLILLAGLGLSTALKLGLILLGYVP